MSKNYLYKMFYILLLESPQSYINKLINSHNICLSISIYSFYYDYDKIVIFYYIISIY